MTKEIQISNYTAILSRYIISSLILIDVFSSAMAANDSLPAKTAQQMAMDSDQPPSKYIFNNTTKFGPLETSPPFAPVPVIDISRLYSSSKQGDQATELDKLRLALATWGCFQV